MSEEGGRRFRLAKSVNEEDEAIQNAIPPSTRYKTTVAAPRDGLGGTSPPISHQGQLSNSSKSGEKRGGGVR